MRTAGNAAIGRVLRMAVFGSAAPAAMTVARRLHGFPGKRRSSRATSRGRQTGRSVSSVWVFLRFSGFVRVWVRVIQVVWVGAVIWSIRVLHIIQVLRSDRQARAIRLVSAARMVGAPGRLGHPDGWGTRTVGERGRKLNLPGVRNVPGKGHLAGGGRSATGGNSPEKSDGFVFFARRRNFFSPFRATAGNPFKPRKS